MNLSTIFALFATFMLALGWHGCALMRRGPIDRGTMFLSYAIALAMLLMAVISILLVPPCNDCEEPHAFAMFASGFAACGAGIILNGIWYRLRRKPIPGSTT